MAQASQRLAAMAQLRRVKAEPDVRERKREASQKTALVAAEAFQDAVEGLARQWYELAGL